MKIKRNLFRAKVYKSDEIVEGLLIAVDSGYTMHFIGDSPIHRRPVNGFFCRVNRRYMETKMQVVDEFGNEKLYDIDESTIEFLELN